MTNLIYVFILQAVLLLASCSSAPSTSSVTFNEKEAGAKKMSVKTYYYKQNDSLSKYLTADVEYFQVEGDGDLANEINNKVLGPYLGMAEGIPDNPNILLDTFFTNMYIEIGELVSEMGETSVLPYSYMYKSKVDVVNDSLFSFEQEAYEYTGGAHGNGGKWFSNYDLKSKKELLLKDLFSSDELLILDSLGEIAFRKSKKIPKRKALEELGYEFDGAFHLPESFLLDRKALVFYFAPYEIGPYSLGDAEFEISYKLIKAKMPNAQLFSYIND